jgi:hypothetical protein
MVLQKPSMNANAAIRASACERKLRRSSNSHSMVAKNASAIALSCASPTEPVEARTPASLHRKPKATDVHWLPWSE